VEVSVFFVLVCKVDICLDKAATIL